MRFFSRVEGFPNKGIPHHLVLELEPFQWIADRQVVDELRQTVLPHFTKAAQIRDFQENGLRLVVDLKKNESPVIHLMAGPDVAAQNPQDWLTPSALWNPKAPAVFFERCAEAAQTSQERMAFGNEMLYDGNKRIIFGVRDGDPKSETHFLILCRQVFGHIMDPRFTYEHLRRFFETALSICHQFGLYEVGSSLQDIRFVANTGKGFQMGPRVHMHVMSSSDGLPSLFPVDYGFVAGPKGVISSPTGSPDHDQIIRLIQDRSKIQGFTPEAQLTRAHIDEMLMSRLVKLRRV